MKTIRVTSVEALEELRQMVQVLRSADADEQAETSPITADITWDDVLRRAENQGLDISVTGQLPDQLPTTLRTVILRILQESLTNAAKYGDGCAEVHLEQQDEHLILTVDSGLSTQECPEAEALSGGSGLIAMTERAQAVGGSLEAGEHRESWRVRGILPYQEVTL